MNALDLAIELVKKHEGFREFAYPDPYSPLGVATRAYRWGFKPASEIYETLPEKYKKLNGRPWTVGFGETLGITADSRMSLAEAIPHLRTRVAFFQKGVRKAVGRTDMPPHEEAALISFAYNVGLDEDEDLIAEGLGDSTLLKKYKAGDILGAADQFLVWHKAGGASGVLTRRREEERSVFLGQHPMLRAH